MIRSTCELIISDTEVLKRDIFTTLASDQHLEAKEAGVILAHVLVFPLHFLHQSAIIQQLPNREGEGKHVLPPRYVHVQTAARRTRRKALFALFCIHELSGPRD